MEERIDKIENEIRKLQERNLKVEADKRWETSWLRRFFVALFTYIPIALYMYFIGVHSPWLNAIVPTLGFLISTLSLPWIKKRYLAR